MKRHYYVSEDLAELEKLEHELEDSGLGTEQIHVLSEREAELEEYDLNPVDSISKKDVIRSGLIGLGVGLVGAALMTVLFLQTGLYDSATWGPAVVFIVVAFVGFCAWEGGLWGIQTTNRAFARFQKELKRGRHVFFVDVNQEQEAVLIDAVAHHENVKPVGDGDGAPQWVIEANKSFNRFTRWAP